MPIKAMPIDQLAACVRWYEYAIMTHRVEHVADTPCKLLAVWTACRACDWDVYADQLSERQLREALEGIVPNFRETPQGLKPVYRRKTR